jgi:hypothetical protein
MTRLTFRRRLTSALAALGLAATLAIPATVLASPPNWSMTVVELPSSVSPSNTAGYLVTVTNNGPSNISKLFLTTNTANNPATAFVQGTGCRPAGEPLFCSLGAVRKGRSVSVLVAYQTAASGSEYSIVFEANTGGASDSDGGSSHGDVLTETGTTALNGDTQDFYGAFATAKGDAGNNQNLTSSNPQTTLVKLPAGNIAVTVQDGPGVTGTCPFEDTSSSSVSRSVSQTNPHNPPPETGCFGQVSEIHVNQGAQYPAGFAVVIRWDSSLHPPTANSIDIWHEFDAPKAGGVTGEDITVNCQFQGGASVPKNVPCLQRSSLSGGDKQVIVWLKENGKTFGH